MQINKASESVFRKTKSAYHVSRQAASFVSESLNTDTHAEEDDFREIDPARYLTKKERRAWNRLSDVRKEMYIRMGMEAAKRRSPQKGISKRRIEENAAEEFLEDSGRKKRYKKMPGLRKRRNSGSRITAEVPAVSGSGLVKESVKKTSSAGAAAISGGAGIAVTASKRTAEKFRQHLKEKEAALRQSSARMQSRIDSAKEKSMEEGTISSQAAYMTAAAAGTFVQAALVLVQAGTAVLSAVMIIFLPLLAGTVILSLLASLIAVVTELNNSHAGYGLPQFITEEMMEALFEEQAEHGIPVSSGIAQIIQESGFGVYGPGGNEGQGLSGLAYNYKNLFGMKTHRCPHVSGSVNMQTGEQTPGGDSYVTTAGFSTFASYTDSIRCRTVNLLGGTYYRYISPYLNPNDGSYTPAMADNFVSGIRAGGWATDIHYVTELQSHMEKYNLYQFDNMTFEEYQAGQSDVSSVMIGDYAHPCPGFSYVSSHFGGRASPGGIGSTNHKGVDLAAASGTPIYAILDGTVETAQYNSVRGYYVKIDHGGGIATISQHMTSYTVGAGQSVRKGQLIGYVGTTGASTGAHLHFEFHVNGVPEDPESYLKF